MEKNRVKEKIIITVDADTGSFERKLRAIAKHTEALADEFAEIDKQESIEREEDE